MSLGLNGWDMDDVHKEMRGKSIFEILELYKQKESLSMSKATEYIQALSDENEKAKERIQNEINHLAKEKCVIALHITDHLIKN